jgi:hypothetical protein
MSYQCLVNTSIGFSKIVKKMGIDLKVKERGNQRRIL